jgi:hypothetical protein
LKGKALDEEILQRLPYWVRELLKLVEEVELEKRRKLARGSLQN